MKNSLVLRTALAAQLLGGIALAQGSGSEVTVLRMTGPRLGVRLAEVDKDVVARLKLKEEKGALITEVVGKSAAEKAGLMKDDVILRFQGESILTAAQLTRLVRDVPSGRRVDLDVVRAGAPLQASVTLERAAGNGEWSSLEGGIPDLDAFSKRMGETFGMLRNERSRFRESLGSREGRPRAFGFTPGERGRGSMLVIPAGKGRFGITFTEIEGQLASYFKAPGDTAILVNSVVRGSAAEKAGVKAGDLVTAVGGVKVADGSDLQSAISSLEAGKKTPITVWRDGKSLELSAVLDDDGPPKAETPRRRRPVS